jgi:hypothetical protein
MARIHLMVGAEQEALQVRQRNVHTGEELGRGLGLVRGIRILCGNTWRFAMRNFYRLLVSFCLVALVANGHASPPLLGSSITVTANTQYEATVDGVIITATVTPASGSGVPSGTVLLYVSSSYQVSCVLSQGSCQAIFDIGTLPTGPNTVTGTYSGDNVYAGSVSSPCVFSYVNNPAPPKPVFSPMSGTYNTPQLVSLTSVPGTNIYYTMGASSDPSTYTLYTEPFVVSTYGILEAYAQYTTAPFTAGPQALVDYEFQPAQSFGGYGSQITFNGTAFQATSGYLQLTRPGVINQAGSLFSTAPQSILTFTNDFSFTLTNNPGANPDADGIMFVIQNQGPNALGAYGGYLGYGSLTPGTGIQNSVGIKFDLYDNSGEGNNSTGLYINGATPTVPAIDLTPSGINLHSGHQFQVHMTYDGTTLTVTTTDVSGASNSPTVTQSYPIDIPGIVGNSSAYIGFTGGTGGLAALQEIGSWMFTPGTPVATPAFSPPPTTVTPSVMLTDATPYAQIFYTLDGSNPTTSAIPYTAPFSIQGTTTVNAIAYLVDNYSAVASATFTSPQPFSINLPNGFTPASLILNGSSALNGSSLQLTRSGVINQASSAFYPTPVGVQTFITDFDFQITNPDGNFADGFMFVLQSQGVNALGAYGENLGYGGFGSPPGIQPSIGIKFDLYNNAGEGSNSTYIYKNGATPTIPAYDLTPFGIDLHSGHLFHVEIANLPRQGYGTDTYLTVTITDTVTQATATQGYEVNLPILFGASTAYAGFTGGTGGFASNQNILNWTYMVP